MENTDLIELFVSGLEIEDNQMLFRLIAGIGIILAHNSKYKPVMEAFGLKKYLKRLCVSECERVSQLVATVYESFF